MDGIDLIMTKIIAAFDAKIHIKTHSTKKPNGSSGKSRLGAIFGWNIRKSDGSSLSSMIAGAQNNRACVARDGYLEVHVLRLHIFPLFFIKYFFFSIFLILFINVFLSNINV